MLEGAKLTFDEESQALYDAVAPTHPDSYFEATLKEIDQALPGEGPLVDRYEAFRAEVHRPRRSAVARVRPRDRRVPRPDAARTCSCRPTRPSPSSTCTSKPWSGYNWYQGNYRSLIQVNTDLPIYIDRAIDLACHEGYPGHHVYNALLEKHLVRDRGWVEFSVYALFSPQSLIAEGTANYGIEVAFPGERTARVRARRAVPARRPRRVAGRRRTTKMRALVDRLVLCGQRGGAQVPQRRVDAHADGGVADAIRDDAGRAAEQRTRFFDTYRSYVINYNLGKDLVKQYVESKGGVASQPERRWQEFVRLLASPRLPSGLRALPPPR